MFEHTQGYSFLNYIFVIVRISFVVYNVISEVFENLKKPKFLCSGLFFRLVSTLL